MDADQPNSQQLNPAALTPADAARLLTAASGLFVAADMVQAAIDAGAPVLADGRLNLVELMAWLEKVCVPKTPSGVCRVSDGCQRVLSATTR